MNAEALQTSSCVSQLYGTLHVFNRGVIMLWQGRMISLVTQLDNAFLENALLIKNVYIFL